jgi:hypothetical protein
VDKSGCVKLAGLVFDVGVALIRRRVSLRYDPFDLKLIEVWYEGKFQRKAEQLYINEFAPRMSSSPASAETKKPTHSRLLSVYEEKNKTREKQRNNALDFSSQKDEEEQS